MVRWVLSHWCPAKSFRRAYGKEDTRLVRSMVTLPRVALVHVKGSDFQFEGLG